MRWTNAELSCLTQASFPGLPMVRLMSLVRAISGLPVAAVAATVGDLPGAGLPRATASDGTTFAEAVPILEHALDRATGLCHETDKKDAAVPLAVIAAAGFLAPHLRLVEPATIVIFVIVLVGTAALFAIGFAVVALATATTNVGADPGAIMAARSLDATRSAVADGLAAAVVEANGELRRKVRFTNWAVLSSFVALLGVATLELLGAIR